MSIEDSTGRLMLESRIQQQQQSKDVSKNKNTVLDKKCTYIVRWILGNYFVLANREIKRRRRRARWTG